MEGDVSRGDGLISVRATVHLSDLPVGASARVDPEDPYIAELLRATFLIRLESVGDVTPGASAAARQVDGHVDG